MVLQMSGQAIPPRDCMAGTAEHAARERLCTVPQLPGGGLDAEIIFTEYCGHPWTGSVHDSENFEFA
jgi:hypothetical protein